MKSLPIWLISIIIMTGFIACSSGDKKKGNGTKSKQSNRKVYPYEPSKYILKTENGRLVAYTKPVKIKKYNVVVKDGKHLEVEEILPPGVSVYSASLSQFAGKYSITDPSRNFSEYHAEAVLYPNGEGNVVEYVDNQVTTSDNTTSDGNLPIKWSYQNGKFVFDATHGGDFPTNGIFEGSTQGNTNEFTIDGKWAGGKPGTTTYKKTGTLDY